MELVSVIVPCYNQAKYLSEAINSVLKQNYNYWECIIVNDGSNDETERVALEWCTKDSRIKYVNKPNGGLSSARNYGVKHSTGKFILPLDADDKIGADYISLAIKEFRECEQVKLVYCRAKLFGNEQGEWKLPEFNYENLLLFNILSINS